MPNHMLMIKSHTDFTDIISATAQPRLIITSLPQPITVARPERSNARAERVARSRGVEQSETLGIVAPTMMRLKDAKIGFLGGCFRVFQTLFF